MSPKSSRKSTKRDMEPEKENRKIDTQIIVAVITVIGTIVAALLASPLIGKFSNAVPTPSETAKIPATIQPTDTQVVLTQIPTPLISSNDIPDTKGVPMVLVPAGKFTMGGTLYEREEPIHDVYLDNFYIDKYEVTNAYYKACVESGSCQLPKDASRYKDIEYSNYPVVYITWSMAQTYCEWRGGRLPTEAEWEKAARGTDGRTFPWGETIDATFANYNSSVGDTTPVGNYENGKSPYGVYDMSGNVYEWVFDWYLSDYYTIVGDNAANPSGPLSPPYDSSNSDYGRVWRGGRWSTTNGNHLRAAYRDWDAPDVFYSSLGFRCARPENPQSANITPTADDRNLPITINNNGAQMVLVPAGEFTMGSDQGDSDEKPVHTVYLDSYYLDVYEVTNVLYKACVDANICNAPYTNKSSTRTNYYGNPEYDNFPVVAVDWNMADTYCGWRDARLPTEAEWEKAARGTDEREFPWGEDIDNTFANYDDYLDDTAAVGSYEIGISPFGNYDMAGNVWEWVADGYLDTYYLGSPLRNPAGPSQVDARVERGGSFNNSDTSLRTANRHWNLPTERFTNLGFRCALDANP